MCLKPKGSCLLIFQDALKYPGLCLLLLLAIIAHLYTIYAFWSNLFYRIDRSQFYIHDFLLALKTYHPHEIKYFEKKDGFNIEYLT